MLETGKSVFIRTVTNYYTGRIAANPPKGFVLLEEAAWIADTGRFSAALKSGTLSEIEPFPGAVAVSLGAIVDISPWDHELPRAVK